MQPRFALPLSVLLILSILSGCVSSPIVGCTDPAAVDFDQDATQLGSCNYEQVRPASPEVVSLAPENGDVDVNADLENISITFDIPMNEIGWSLAAENDSTFPALPVEPRFIDQYTFVAPVTLVADQKYVILINMASSGGFQSAESVLLEPFRWTFSTVESIQDEAPNSTSEESAEAMMITSIPTEWSIFDDEDLFSKYVDVFGVHIFASDDTPDDKINHAAAVLAQYLDNDEDGGVDDIAVIENMTAVNASLFMVAEENDIDDIFENIPESVHQKFDSGEFWAQDLYAEETKPSADDSDEFDGALEEILHLISNSGYARAYPAAFLEVPGSLIAENMDLARGGHFEESADDECEGNSLCALPAGGNYPAEAWYSYDDETCDYGCMIAEYFYWALTSILDAQSDRCEDIEDEWDACTNALMQSLDSASYALLTDPAYNLPTVLPNGHYMSFHHPEMDSCISHSQQLEHFHPYLLIFVDDQQISIPESSGIEQGCMHVIHTHDDSGRLHVEMQVDSGYDGLPLGLFMHFIGMEFGSCMLGENQVDSNHWLNMTVYENTDNFTAGDGAPNFEFEDYLLMSENDGEIIVIEFEQGLGNQDCL